MSKKAYDLVVKTGSYTDRNGNQKNKYENVGSVMENEDGGKFILLKRTFNPAGVANPENKETVLLSYFKLKDNKTESEPESESYSSDDIPF